MLQTNYTLIVTVCYLGLHVEALILMLEKEDRGQRGGQWVPITRYLHLTLCCRVPGDVLSGRAAHG